MMVVQTVTVADSPAPIAALNCNETDSLLQVKYNITEDEYSSLVRSIGDYPFLNVQDNTLPVWEDSTVVRYYWFPGLTDYEACLPRDECSRITVGGFPTDAYELSFDGKAVDIGDEILFNGNVTVTATGVGSCAAPICKDTEALLEAQFWAIGSSANEPFLVEDKESNIILHGSTVLLDNKHFFNKTSVCLPKDNACYTFLIGGDMQSDMYKPWGENFPAQPSYSLFFDGKLMHRSDSWLFDSVQFGDSCKPLCNQEDESLVEFFMFDTDQKFSLEHDEDVDNVPQVKYEYGWDLSVVNRSSSVSVSSGVVPQGPGFSPLVHKIMCIPKGSCSSFYISVPNPNGEYHNSVYSLTMDNITYRKASLPFNQSQTTNMGSCTVNGLCDVQTQDLFHLELRTPDKNENPYASSFPAQSIKSWNMYWYFSNGWMRDNHYNDVSYDLNSSFGVIECVPNGGCDSTFDIRADWSVESYTVKKNGVQLDATQVTDVNLETTPFGQNCSPSIPPSTSSLSGGAIAGIVIACIVAGGAVVFGLVSYRRRQSQLSNEEENPLHESLFDFSK